MTIYDTIDAVWCSYYLNILLAENRMCRWLILTHIPWGHGEISCSTSCDISPPDLMSEGKSIISHQTNPNKIIYHNYIVSRCIVMYIDGYDSYDTIEAGFHIWFWPDMIGFCPKKGPNDVSICLPSIAGQESLYCALVQWQVTWLQSDLCRQSKNGHTPKLWQSKKLGAMKKNPLDDIWHSHDAGWTHCNIYIIS